MKILPELEKILEALELEDPKDLVLVDAAGLDDVVASGVQVGPLLHPSFPPSLNILIHSLTPDSDLSKFGALLRANYPLTHGVRLVYRVGSSDWKVENDTVGKLGRDSQLKFPAIIFIPPLPAEFSFETFQQVIARLRAPDGCPWDREQTHLSLRPNLLEEAYEALEAVEREDPKDMTEEFGDLLLQIVLHAQIAYEAGEFSMADVLEGINHKIIHRHPHVFKDTPREGVEGVLKNWEKLKEAERKGKGVDEEKGILDGAPKSQPALSLAQEYQDRAARVGFDWPSIEPVLQKVHEELGEVEAARNVEELTHELGDLLFAVVNLVRWHKVDAESALREMNRRFSRRFKHIEKQAKKTGRSLSDMSLEEMDRFWEEAKSLEE